jgi:hypothetical protein
MNIVEINVPAFLSVVCGSAAGKLGKPHQSVCRSGRQIVPQVHPEVTISPPITVTRRAMFSESSVKVFL